MRIPHLRWYIAVLLFTSTVINYVDRQTLSIMAPVLTKELNISQVEYANILQALLIAYTVMYVGSGILVDRWGTRLALAVGAIIAAPLVVWMMLRFGWRPAFVITGGLGLL